MVIQHKSSMGMDVSSMCYGWDQHLGWVGTLVNRILCLVHIYRVITTLGLWLKGLMLLSHIYGMWTMVCKHWSLKPNSTPICCELPHSRELVLVLLLKWHGLEIYLSNVCAYMCIPCSMFKLWIMGGHKTKSLNIIYIQITIKICVIVMLYPSNGEHDNMKWCFLCHTSSWDVLSF